MLRTDLKLLVASLAVARERSFTRAAALGGLYAWEFEKEGRGVRVRVEGQLVSNTSALSPEAALAGLGLAHLPEDRAQPYLADGRLVRVLADRCPPFPGYHLYYPSRRHSSLAFALVLEALRHWQVPAGP